MKTLLLLFVIAIMLQGCGAGMAVTSVDSTAFPPTEKVTVIHKKPEQPFVVVARFSGELSLLCPQSDPYCKLRERAMTHGGDAIWIQRVEVKEYPGEWIMVQGHLTHIYATKHTYMEGVIVHYLTGIDVAPQKHMHND